jgi:hypothetical protein
MSMPETCEELLEQVEAELERARSRVRDLETTKRCLLSLETKEEDPQPSADSSLSDSSRRFKGVSQEIAVTLILRESGQMLNVNRIVHRLLAGGYGNGRKTAKQIRGSVNAVLSAGTKKGLYENVGRGLYQIAGEPVQPKTGTITIPQVSRPQPVLLNTRPTLSKKS